MATEQTVHSISYPVVSTSTVAITVSGQHVYSNISANNTWQLAIYLDGTLLKATGGGTGVTDNPNLEAVAYNVSAASHTVKVTWYGTTNMQLKNCTCDIEATYK